MRYDSLPLSQMAGAAVKKATETLVNAAQQAALHEEQNFMDVKVKGKVMAGFRKELEMQEAIAKKTRELEQAKAALTRIRREQAGH